MLRPLIFIGCFITLTSWAQDSLYTRNAIGYLTSKKCYGRGYLNNGLQYAEQFLISEIRKTKAQPLFGKSFTQSFIHSVNTFPANCEVSLNGQKLRPGLDFILNPSSLGVKGQFDLTQKDSVHFENADKKKSVIVSLHKKLTYSVASEVKTYCEILLDKNRLKESPKNIRLNIKNKLVNKFESKNIGCLIKGSLNSDSVIVFSAHYDHLGGMGKNTFFPGANDNASGVSFLLNLLKYYNNNPPKYTHVFIWFAGEEAGLVGSNYFVRNSPISLDKIKFLINMDLLGTGDDGIMVVNGTIYKNEFNKLLELNSKLNLVKEIKKRGKAANSDHYWFSESNVPCFFIYTLGGISAYHDIHDIEKTLPLTDYFDVFKLVTTFISEL